MRYQHAVRVLDNGCLQAQCAENNQVHWVGEEHPQNEGAALAHVRADKELRVHVESTDHRQAVNRHGKR